MSPPHNAADAQSKNKPHRPGKGLEAFVFRGVIPGYRILIRCCEPSVDRANCRSIPLADDTAHGGTMPAAVAIDEDVIAKFDEIERVLDATYGPRVLRESGDPTSELVGTILSQNTSDVNTARSMERLREEFPTWDDVREAPVEDIVDAIRSGGLANIKGPRIQEALEHIVSLRGDTDLAFLKEMPLDDAMAWLTSINGVGPKTAACVMLFSLGMPAMPVDTHVGRVMTRLGVLPDRTSTLTKQRILDELIGPNPNQVYAVHVETISHGRQICKSLRPKCEICPLKEVCVYAKERSI
jgi:endonuclease III